MNLYRKENHNYLENVDNYERNGELKRFKVIVKEISLCENIKGFLFRAMKKLLSGPVMFLPEDKTSSKWGERERENGGEERKVPQSSWRREWHKQQRLVKILNGIWAAVTVNMSGTRQTKGRLGSFVYVPASTNNQSAVFYFSRWHLESWRSIS